MKNPYTIDGDIVRIKLTKGQEAIIDLADMELVGQYRWYTRKAPHTFYAETNVRQPDGRYKVLKMHRLLCSVTPERPIVDHENHDGLDNRRTNLRPSTQTENNRNQTVRTPMTSAFKGVYWYKAGRIWRSQIRIGSKPCHLGGFISERDAALAYDQAARAYFCDFQVLNFPDTHDYSGLQKSVRKNATRTSEVHGSPAC